MRAPDLDALAARTRRCGALRLPAVPLSRREAEALLVYVERLEAERETLIDERDAALDRLYACDAQWTAELFQPGGEADSDG